MKNVTTIFSLLFTQAFLFFSIATVFCQGSMDADTAVLSVEGGNHATLKIRSDGYLSDTTELKFTNMDAIGTGTEFVIRSANETGLSVSSNSDLTGNTANDILLLQPSGNVLMSSLTGTGQEFVGVNSDGRLLRVPNPSISPQNFSIRTNLNTANPTVKNTTWTAVGPSLTFTKDENETLIDASLQTLARHSTSTSPNFVRYELRITGQTAHRQCPGAVAENSTWEFITAQAIFKNLPAGTYTIQIFGRSNNGNADPFFGPAGTILVEERY